MKPLILAILALAAFTASLRGQITIGVDISTTGPLASLGIPNKNALLLAPTTIAGQKINYVILDDASDTSAAVQNVKRLISENNIDLLLGPSVTPTTLAVTETVAAAKTPLISYGSASSIVAPMDSKKQWIFKTTAND